MSRLDWAIEAGLLGFGLLGAWMITQAPGHPAIKWGFAVLLVSQVFWFAAAWRARRWGIFLNTAIYTGLWIRGLAHYF